MPAAGGAAVSLAREAGVMDDGTWDFSLVALMPGVAGKAADWELLPAVAATGVKPAKVEPADIDPANNAAAIRTSKVFLNWTLPYRA